MLVTKQLALVTDIHSMEKKNKYIKTLNNLCFIYYFYFVFITIFRASNKLAVTYICLNSELLRVIQRAAKACHSSSLFNYTPHPQHPPKQLIFLNHECRWNTISLWLWATPPVLMLTLFALWSRSDFKRERKKWRKHSLQFYSTSTMNLLLTVYEGSDCMQKTQCLRKRQPKKLNP